MAKLIVSAVLPGSPQRDIVIGSTGREVVGRLVSLAGIEIVHKSRCLVPADSRSRAIHPVATEAGHVPHRDSETSCRVGLGNHVPTDFIFADVVNVAHRTGEPIGIRI